jgi:hypothetical protein
LYCNSYSSAISLKLKTLVKSPLGDLGVNIFFAKAKFDTVNFTKMKITTHNQRNVEQNYCIDEKQQ